MKIVVDTEAGAALPEVANLLANYAQFKGKYQKLTKPPKVAKRYARGPVFFKFVRVDYDKENKKLKLSQGEFAGHAVTSGMRGNEERNKVEYDETIMDMGKEDSDLSGEAVKQLECDAKT